MAQLQITFTQKSNTFTFVYLAVIVIKEPLQDLLPCFSLPERRGIKPHRS